MTLKQIISSLAKRGKYYNKFFPKERLKTAQGRFELLGLSILDVYGYNADKLWSEIAPELRKRNIISIEYLKRNSVKKIKASLENAGYKRGNDLTNRFAYRLKKLSEIISKKPFKKDVSNIFKSYREHNRDTLISILKEFRKMKVGIGPKVGKMFLKFMLSTFKQWKWKGGKVSLSEIAPPIDSQVKKVYTRFVGLDKPINRLENDLETFCKKKRLSFIEIDDVFWNVGRIFCNKYPACHYCPLERFCKYAKFRRRKDSYKIKKHR